MIVKYNNDLNQMPLPKFKGRQYDLFFSIISMIKEKHDGTPALKRFFDPEKRQIIVPYKKFLDICRAYEWNRSFTEVHNEIKNFMELLLEYKISYETKNSYYTFVCFEEAEYKYDTQAIHITFQKRFYDMVVDYSLGFTRFELAEFISLSSKYAKTLYRLLKQYRNTGFMRMEWEEFMRIMDIPYTRQIDIDQRILKPTIKELTKPRNLFDKERVPFKNLKYTKIKGKGRGRGGNVVGIEFRFDIENLEQELLESNHFFDEKFKAEVDKAKGNYLSKNGEWLYINNITYADSKIAFNLYHKDTNKYFSRTYTKDEYEKDIKPFIINAANMQKVF